MDVPDRRIVTVAEAKGEAVIDGKGLAWRRPGQPDAPVVGACLSLTTRCNERCVMCMEPRDPQANYDMPLDDALGLADLFAGRVPIVYSSASEPLLYPHFLDYAQAIKAGGSTVGVVTNGLAIARPNYFEACVEAGLGWVMLSCHTAHPETFGELTGVARAWPKFLSALQILDSYNRGAPQGGRIQVMIEVVVMRPLLREIDDLLDFVAERLAHSDPVLRIETFRPFNSARERLDLQPNIDEVAQIVARATARWPHGSLLFRNVPLCLLPGCEHLADEVTQVLHRETVLGNRNCWTTELTEQMIPPAALADARWSEPCRRCDLALICTGPADIPVPEASAWPRPAPTRLPEVAAKARRPLNSEELNARLELLMKERDPRAPRPGPDRAASDRGPSESANPASPPATFSAAEAEALRSLVAWLEDEGLARHPKVRAERIELELVAVSGAERGAPATLWVIPAAPGEKYYQRIGRFLLGCSGTFSPQVEETLERTAAWLDSLEIGDRVKAGSSPRTRQPLRSRQWEPRTARSEPTDKASTQFLDGRLLLEHMDALDRPFMVDFMDFSIRWSNARTRYTPTEFADLWRTQLSNEALVNPDYPLAIYFHVPFCTHSCAFCRCFRLRLDRTGRSLLARYADYLCDQMDFFAPALSGQPIRYFSIGGGTPSVLPPDELARVLRRFYDRYDVHRDTPLTTVEMSFPTMRDETLDVLSEFEIPRISVGVQTLQPRVRRHNKMFPIPLDALAERVAAARKRGIHCNLDLVLGLVDEPAETFIEGFRSVLGAKPSSVIVNILNTDYFKSVALEGREVNASTSDAFLRKVGQAMAAEAKRADYRVHPHGHSVEAIAFFSPEFDELVSSNREVLRRLASGVHSAWLGTSVFAFGALCNLSLVPNYLMGSFDQEYTFRPDAPAYQISRDEVYGILYGSEEDG